MSNSIGTPVREVIANSQHEHRRHPARERLRCGEPGRVVSYHQRMQLGPLPRQRRKGTHPHHRATIAGRTMRSMAQGKPDHIPPRQAQPVPTPLHVVPRARPRQTPRPRMRYTIWDQMRAPVSQGDGVGVDIAGGLRHGRDGVRGQYVDDSSGIGRHHPGVERLPAVALRFRRVHAVMIFIRLYTGLLNVIPVRIPYKK